MEKMNNFYKNKKILVTGATGFKGSWLCCWLLQMGAKVYGTGYSPNQNKNLLALSLLFIQPIFMASNLIIARGGVEFVPPISLAF